MTINIGHLHKKRTVRNLRGEIVEMVDETKGGDIIRRGRVVNQEALAEVVKIQNDKKVASSAQANAIQAPVEVVAERQQNPGKVEKLEKEVGQMKDDINKILSILTKDDKGKNK